MKIVNLNSRVPSNLKDDIGVKALNLTKLSKIEYVDVPCGVCISARESLEPFDKSNRKNSLNQCFL